MVIVGAADIDLAHREPAEIGQIGNPALGVTPLRECTGLNVISGGRERIDAPRAQTVGTLFGGNQNQAVLNRTALSILAKRPCVATAMIRPQAIG